MALEGEVKLPGGAKVSKKAAAGGLIVVVTLIGVYYWKKRSSASSSSTAAAAATTTDQYPPDGTTGNPSDPYSTDPATGQTYGDEAAGTGTYGAYGSGYGEGADLYPPDGTTGNPNDPYSIDPATGVTYGDEGYSGGTGTGTGTRGPPFSSNSAWSNWVVQQEQSLNPDVNVSDLMNALGLYLAGQPVTAAQKTLIFDATALAGDPPVSGPGGYPPNVRTQGNGGGSAETVPDLKGKDADSALAALKAAHLKGTLSETRKAGHTYTVTGQSPAAGRRVAENSTVKVTITEKPSTGHPETDVQVPSVTGRQYETAARQITAAGLVPKRGQKDVGVVMTQKPAAGARVKKGSTVTLTGPRPGQEYPG